MTTNRQTLKHMTFMEIAQTISQLGTCCRLKVGAVLLRKDGSVASMGYNGAPTGMDHCNDSTCNSENRCIHTLHAEENALRFFTGEAYSAYLTHEPCLNCTRDMALRGIKKIYFDARYSSMPEREKAERIAIMQHFGITISQL
jgi:dCMP deaminase